MISSSKILVAVPLAREESKNLLSWAINSIAKPSDTIVAFHVLVGEEPRNFPLKKKKRAQIRLAKAHVISVLAEFTRSCHSKQVNLEAKVGFSSSVGRGLVDEAKSISAHYLLLSRPTNHDFRKSLGITKYATEFAPPDCAVILVGRQKKRQKDSFSDCTSTIPKEIKRESSSPRSVWSALERDSVNSSSDDASSFTGSTSSTNFLSSVDKPKPKPLSPYRLISSLISNSPMRRWRGNYSKKNPKPQPLMRCFSYAEISKATNEFHEDNIVGVGGYSEVYRGDLSDGKRIAVKRLAKDNSDMNKEKEFLTELGIISHVSHPNTANLLGCCIERGLYLIFSLSENGNLYSALHEDNEGSLDWPIRYKIAVGVARGLHYLHKRCNHRIIHRDIKASNVLLGPDYEPQITDFGLAKWLPNKWTHHAVMPVEGTFGYLAPEYFMHGIVDEKTDVYAFGILLLEILTGRKPVGSSQRHLLLWAKPIMETGKTRELADPKLKGRYDEQQIQRLILTASHCVHQSPIFRPSMTQVLELLTCGNEADIGNTWRILPKQNNPREEEMDDYSMILGYDVPFDYCFDSVF
ncbi:PREDICTED: probable receptor-like serine/threonine-protein kinase At5g57670 [Tarenaya hassleriana]|uniref:probable receptor-like serine/threonine-protein kinase At5g57670 n=1 Tax=Tarenaya hassleriana TaxID=28532 RepID=UPI00053C1B5A|nr:PREDICTED: probable receptor-like serine/threonine-protein kinase At5g57670 [Tarenaya hassleriana]